MTRRAFVPVLASDGRGFGARSLCVSVTRTLVSRAFVTGASVIGNPVATFRGLR
jgi:hypothetical protein